MDRKTFTVELRNRGGAQLTVDAETPILTVSEAAGYPLPVACRYGGCITCAAKLISGKVVQPKGTALNKRQSKEGYVLLCVAQPRSDCVVEVGVESHATLYSNPFATGRS